MKHKRWSVKEKLEILEASEKYGIVETCRKYGVSTRSLYSWKKKFESQGEAGLKAGNDVRSKEV
ncbi:MAG: putative transposase, partial [Vicingaceae bacterium]